MPYVSSRGARLQPSSPSSVVPTSPQPKRMGRPPSPVVAARRAEHKKLNVGVSALAREVGLTNQAVGRKLSMGMTPDEIRMRAGIRVGKDSKNGLLSTQPKMELDFAVIEAQEETRHQAERRKEVALANEREIIVAQKRGELIPRTQVMNFVSGRFVALRDRLMRFGQENQDAIAVEAGGEAGKAAAVGSYIEGKMREILEDLAEYTGAGVEGTTS